MNTLVDERTAHFTNVRRLFGITTGRAKTRRRNILENRISMHGIHVEGKIVPILW
jgi:hypothetical protein